MAQALPTDIDLAQLCLQFSSDLAQSQSLEAGGSCCVSLIESCFAPRACQIIWDAGRGTRVLAPDPGVPPTHPDADELAKLQNGQLALRLASEHVVACFAPLRARGLLLGWLFVEHSHWGTESGVLLSMIAAQAGPALAMLDTASRQDERVAQLQTLNEIGRLLSGVLDLDTLLDAIHGAVSRLIDATTFYIALYDPTEDELDLAYTVLDDKRRQLQDHWVSGSGLVGQITRERRPIRADDYVTECRRRGIESRPLAGLRFAKAWLGVPLLANDRLMGVMVVCSLREGYTYSDEHVELLMTIGAQAAVAIENARLYQRSERQARQLAALNHIGRTITSSLDPERVPSLIMEQVSDLLDVEEGSLLLIDNDTGDLVFAYTIGPIGSRLVGQRLPRGTGLAGYVATYEQSVIVNDVQQDERFDGSTDKTTGFVTRSLLAVPLRAVGGLQGVIEVLNRRDGSQFTEEDQRLLEAVADQAVIALENARRFAQVDQALARRAQELVSTNDRLQHSLRSLTALNALGMAINTTLRDAEEIFGMTARGVVEMSSALGACVLIAEEQQFRASVQIGPVPPRPDLLAPLLQRVMETGRPEITVADLPRSLVQHGIRALMVVPLRATQRVIGCLCVYYADAVPDAPDQETVVLFATQAAVAVESIELFTAVRSGRDQMASILASTREGIMLITPDAHVAIANAALHQLCGLAPRMTQNCTVEGFLSGWGQRASYPPDEWSALCEGLDAVMSGRQSFVSGELNEQSAHLRSVEWAALTALSSGASSGGALLVLRDITDAKEAERLRQDLTNMIVHDLRSPLSSVMASIELLTRGISGQLNTSQHNVLEIAYASALQMLEMVNTLLDISRLEAGRMPLELQVCAVRPLVDRAAERLISLAQDRQITINVDVAPDLALVRADNELIVRVLQNLLGNALKFSGRGSTVQVRVFEGPWSLEIAAGNGHTPVGENNGEGYLPAGPAVTLAIRDQGIGIALKDQEKIFTKFGQVGERRGGTGLGLTFCKLVVETHGGRIWVESMPGEGSTFFFTLPAVQ